MSGKTPKMEGSNAVTFDDAAHQRKLISGSEQTEVLTRHIKSVPVISHQSKGELLTNSAVNEILGAKSANNINDSIVRNKLLVCSTDKSDENVNIFSKEETRSILQDNKNIKGLSNSSGHNNKNTVSVINNIQDSSNIGTDLLHMHQQQVTKNCTATPQVEAKQCKHSTRAHNPLKLVIGETASANTNVKFFIGDEQQYTATPRSPKAFSGLQGKPFGPEPVDNKQNLENEMLLISGRDPKFLKKKRGLPQPEFVPPDGGYGWVIVLAACVVNCWTVGFIKSYSVFYVDIIDTFPNSSAYQASYIPALLATIGPLIG